MSNNNLIWKNLGNFWDLVPQDNKEVIEQVWEGLKDSVDDLYFNLYEIDNSKSLKTCPVYTTRRWLMLDLSDENLSSIDEAGRNLLTTNKTVPDSKVNVDSTVYNKIRSIRHKHLVFIYNTINGASVEMPFPLDYTTVEIFDGADILHALVDFTIVDNTIKFLSEGTYNIYLTVDHTIAPFYKHKYVKQTSPNGDINLLSKVNSSVTSFAVVDDGELLNPTQYKILNSNTIKCQGLSGTFEIFWLEEEDENSFAERHEHFSYNLAYNKEANKSGSLTYVNLPAAPVTTIKSGAENIFRVFVNGELTSDYTVNNNLITFSPILTYSANVVLKIHVEWTNVYSSAEVKYHRHYAYQDTNFQSTYVTSAFDDGNIFDDDGYFDTEDEIAELNFPFTIRDVNNVSIWVNGKLLHKDIDYSITEVIHFNISVNGKNLKLTYHESDRIYVYGYENLAYPTSKFEQINLGLFYDETPDYINKTVDSEDANISLRDAISLNFENIKLIAIPAITDGIELWKNIYKQELGTSLNDFEIDNGLIRSDVELPKQAWCPIVYFDERRLAQNFGFLVGHEKTSSSRYKAELANFFRSLWGGPTIQNIEWAVSIILGSPFITKTDTIEKIEPTILNRTVKTQFESFDVAATALLVGNEVKAGQSVASRIHTNGILNDNCTVDGRHMSFTGIGLHAEVGDVLTVVNKQAFSVEAVPTDNSIIISTAPLFPVGVVNTSVDTLTVATDSIGINVSGFYPESKLNEVTPGMFFKTDSGSYTITTNPAGNRVYVETTPTISSNWTIYVKDNFHIASNEGSPYFTTDGTILSIDDNVGNYFRFTSGSELYTSAGISTYLQTGDTVEPFQPLCLVCTVTDTYSEPTWWIDKTEYFRTYNSSRQTQLSQDLQSFERTITVKTTEDFPESGVVSIEGTNSAGFYIFERIFYESKTATQFRNCQRGYRSINSLQNAFSFPAGTFVSIDSSYTKNTPNYLAYQTYKDNLNTDNYNNILDIIPLYAPNVMVLKLSESARTTHDNIATVNNFLNRIMESSVRWYIDLNTSFNEDVLVAPIEQVTIGDVYNSGLLNSINYGRVVSQLFMTTTGIYSGDLIYSGSTYANVVKASSDYLFVDYATTLTFTVGDLVNDVNTITSINDKNILYFPDYILREYQDSLSGGTEYQDTFDTGTELGDIL